MCTKGKCTGHLVDHILDWEDPLPPAELKATEQHTSAAVRIARTCCRRLLNPFQRPEAAAAALPGSRQTFTSITCHLGPGPPRLYNHLKVSDAQCAVCCAVSGRLHLLRDQPADHPCCQPAPAHCQGRRLPGYHQPAGNTQGQKGSSGDTCKGGQGGHRALRCCKIFPCKSIEMYGGQLKQPAHPVRCGHQVERCSFSKGLSYGRGGAVSM